MIIHVNIFCTYTKYIYIHKDGSCLLEHFCFEFVTAEIGKMIQDWVETNN